MVQKVKIPAQVKVRTGLSNMQIKKKMLANIANQSQYYLSEHTPRN